MTRSLAACAAFALLTAAGCATLTESVSPPQVRLAGARLVEAGLMRQTVALTFVVSNPNPIALPVRKVSYALDLAGDRFAEGVTPDRFSIPANGDGEFEIQVSTDISRTLAHLQRWFAGGPTELDYSLGGTLEIDLPLIEPIAFSDAGSVRLSR